MLVKLNTKCNIDSFKKIDECITRSKCLFNNDLKEFLKEKFLMALNETITERLSTGTGAEENTNQEFIATYIANNKFKNLDNGFLLYNDTVIPQSELELTDKTKANYPNGFSVALAFEYGVGIVGQNNGYPNDYFKSWEYNVNNYNFGWRYRKNGKTYATYGYKGMEIYRYTVEKIKNNLSNWLLEYGGKQK